MLKAAAQRTRQLDPGDKLGKYEVIRQIAIGGMAELYLARTVGIEGFEKLVVLKRILPQFVSNQQFVTMFLNEARIAATLHHPNVAQVYDIGLDDGDYFFAMEYVHGEDLDHIAMASEEQGVPISMDASLTLIAGLCAGLNYAHDKATAEGRPLQIVHRDVSPSNVLVSYDGAVKLVDFGIARASSHSGTTANTQGGLKGKINYMSPEQCIAKAQLDRRSDIYAVGTLLYELTTGQLPFSGETEYQVLNQIVNDDVPPPSKVVPGYPPALERIVLRALARNPEQRYSSALELQGAVEDFAHETRLRVSPLVLARLMGTLFPARLEEWDHAKARGAFFVEQHVVRTLIESGKTPDRSDPAMAAAIAAAQARDDAAVRAAERAARASDDDDTTAVNPPPVDDFLTAPPTASGLTDLGGDTSVGAPPIHTRSSTGGNPFVEPTPPPLPDMPSGPSPIVRPSAPRFPTPPRPSQPALPHLLASTGTLVSPTTPQHGMAAVVEPAPGNVDVTERVRLPKRRQPSPTTLIHTGVSVRRRPMLLVLGGLAVAGGIAAFIALRGGHKRLAPSHPGASTTQDISADQIEMEEPTKVERAVDPEPSTTEPSPRKTNAEAPDLEATAPASEPATKDGSKTEPTPKSEPKIEKNGPTTAAKSEQKIEKTLATKSEPKIEKTIATKSEPKIEKTTATKSEPKKAVSRTVKKPTKASTKRTPKATREPKSEPKKESSWNADSPFMPVRTNK